MKNLHETTRSLLSKLGLEDRELAPHLRAALERLSHEHPSGISLAQLETPMMKQYRKVKEEVPDALIFFRMGDFFELFGADAIIVSDICSLTLTSRDRNSDTPVAMAGVPAVAYKQMLKKCILAGYKVAICDQVEDPKQAKGIVRREIVRIASPAVPGDIDDEENSDSGKGCYLASVKKGRGGWALAFVDASTGEFRLTHKLSDSELLQEFLTLHPKEILSGVDDGKTLVQLMKGHFSSLPRVAAVETWVFRSEGACRELFLEFFAAADENRFGISSVEFGLQIVAGLLSYLKSTQRDVLRNLKKIELYSLADYLIIDDATKRHLDFFATPFGERKGSLYWFLNQCVTAMGSRGLARRLNYPFKKASDIAIENGRVSEFFDNTELRESCIEQLRNCADLEKLLSRVASKHIDPRGLAWLRESLRVLPKLKNLLASSYAWKNETSDFECIDKLAPLSAALESALAPEPAAMLGKGGKIFATGFSKELDELETLESGFDTKLAELESKERENSGISTLKVGYTRVFGYYFEISKGKLDKAPAHFIRKQTIANGERFITPELKELEERSLTAGEKRTELERNLFEELRNEILKFADQLVLAAQLVSKIDIATCFAQLAAVHGWCRPEIVNDRVTALKNCVHPVMKVTTREPFVANNIVVGESSKLPEDHFAKQNVDETVLLITGPNMAGKSTVMRSLALTQILFQMGCHVPCEEATLSVCDKVFTRIGSSDHSLKNQSTFMVEMLEAAHMLSQATQDSLLLIDEVGRGTSTFDGLSIAWAILEDLHDRVRARTLFSTHYHELQAVAQNRPSVVSYKMEVLESEDDSGESSIHFTRRFIKGAAEKSYGIHVATLAGLPLSVVRRAEEILASMSDGQQQKVVVESSNTLKPAFTKTSLSEAVYENRFKTLSNKVLELGADELTPRQALELVYELQKLARDNSSKGRAGASKARSAASQSGLTIFDL